MLKQNKLPESLAKGRKKHLEALNNRLRLIRGLAMGDTAFVGPFSVNIDVTHRCNLRCLYCRWHSPLLNRTIPGDPAVKDFAPDQFRRLCASLHSLGTTTLLFVGAGEPLLHPQIFDLLATAKEYQLKVILYTNGTLLNEATITALVSLPLDVLRVSLGASSQEEYQQFYRNGGKYHQRFDKVVKAMQLLSQLKKEHRTMFPILEISHAISRSSVKNLEKMALLAYNTGSKYLHFAVLQPAEGGEQFRPFLLTAKEVNFACFELKGLKKNLHSLGIQHNIEDVILRYRLGESGWQQHPCYIAWQYAYFRVDGIVYACQRCHLPMGDLHKNTFSEIWNNVNYRSFRRESVTLENLTSMQKTNCDCSYCLHLVNNLRVHQRVGWLIQLRKKLFGG